MVSILCEIMSIKVIDLGFVVESSLLLLFSSWVLYLLDGSALVRLKNFLRPYHYLPFPQTCVMVGPETSHMPGKATEVQRTCVTPPSEPAVAIKTPRPLLPLSHMFSLKKS